MKSLKQTRLKHDLTLEQLKDETGVMIAALSRIESGKQVADLSTRRRLEQFFKEHLINWLDTPHIVTSPRFPTTWNETERDFRGFIRRVAGLPETDRNTFIDTACKHLRRLKRSKSYISNLKIK